MLLPFVLMSWSCIYKHVKLRLFLPILKLLALRLACERKNLNVIHAIFATLWHVFHLFLILFSVCEITDLFKLPLVVNKVEYKNSWQTSTWLVNHVQLGRCHKVIGCLHGLAHQRPNYAIQSTGATEGHFDRTVWGNELLQKNSQPVNIWAEQLFGISSKR